MFTDCRTTQNQSPEEIPVAIRRQQRNSSEFAKAVSRQSSSRVKNRKSCFDGEQRNKAGCRTKLKQANDSLRTETNALQRKEAPNSTWNPRKNNYPTINNVNSNVAARETRLERSIQPFNRRTVRLSKLKSIRVTPMSQPRAKFEQRRSPARNTGNLILPDNAATH